MGNSKELSQDGGGKGGGADCLLKMSDLSNDATFIHMHFDGQHLSREFMVELYSTLKILSSQKRGGSRGVPFQPF